MGLAGVDANGWTRKAATRIGSAGTLWLGGLRKAREWTGRSVSEWIGQEGLGRERQEWIGASRIGCDSKAAAGVESSGLSRKELERQAKAGSVIALFFITETHRVKQTEAGA